MFKSLISLLFLVTIAQAQSWNNELTECGNFLLRAHKSTIGRSEYLEKRRSICPDFSSKRKGFVFNEKVQFHLGNNLKSLISYDIYSYVRSHLSLFRNSYETQKQVYDNYSDFNQNSYDNYEEHSYRGHKSNIRTVTVPAKTPEHRDYTDSFLNILKINKDHLLSQYSMDSSSIIKKLKAVEQDQKEDYIKGCFNFILNSYHSAKRSSANFYEPFYLSGQMKYCKKVFKEPKRLSDYNSNKLIVAHFKQNPADRILYELYQYLNIKYGFFNEQRRKSFEKVLELEDGEALVNAHIRIKIDGIEYTNRTEQEVSQSVLEYLGVSDSTADKLLTLCVNENTKTPELVAKYEQIQRGRKEVPEDWSIFKLLEKVEDLSLDLVSEIESMKTLIDERCFDKEFSDELKKKLTDKILPHLSKAIENSYMFLMIDIKNGDESSKWFSRYKNYKTQHDPEYDINTEIAELKKEARKYRLQSIKNYLQDSSSMGALPENWVKEYEKLSMEFYDNEGRSGLIKSRIQAAKSSYERRKTCTGIDNIDKSLQEESLLQGDKSWCGVTAATEVLTHFMGKKVSTAYVGNTYYERIGGAAQRFFDMSEKSFLNSVPTYALSLFKAVRNRGICFEKDMPSINADIRVAITAVEGLVAQLKEVDCSQREQHIKSSSFDYKKYFPHLSADEFSRILLSSEKYNIYDRLVSANCKLTNEEVDFKIKRRLYIMKDSYKEHGHEIDEYLNSGDIVLATIANPKFLEKVYEKKSIPRHYWTITGRRFNNETQRCEYKARDPNGSCQIYSSYECSKGQVWIPDYDLKKMLFETNVLEKK